MRILLSGMLAGVPGQGGATWAALQYLLGLRRLGHDVFFIEPVDPEPGMRTQSELGRTPTGRYFRRLRRRFHLARAGMIIAGTREAYGVRYGALLSFARRADLLVNLSGMLREPALVEPIPTRLYVDLDPAFTQLWSAADGIDMGFDLHTHFATVGLELETGRGPVPTCGREWIGVLPPVVLDRWPYASSRCRSAYTSVANWRGYGSTAYDGVTYGQKAHSFRALADLPLKTRCPIEMALAIHPNEVDDLRMLERNGWRLTEPAAAAGTPDRYHDYVATSRGELAVAKAGYVVGSTGWFSDRSACYLASGRPVIAQDTGFSRHLPVGEGLLAFATAPEAAAALETVEADYRAHRQASRALAEDHLDSDVVLTRLLERATSRAAAVR